VITDEAIKVADIAEEVRDLGPPHHAAAALPGPVHCHITDEPSHSLGNILLSPPISTNALLDFKSKMSLVGHV